MVFDQITVNLKDGQTLKCSEVHRNVRVVDSVLNLEIGAGWIQDAECQLDHLMAGSGGLNFQVCISPRMFSGKSGLAQNPHAPGREGGRA